MRKLSARMRPARVTTLKHSWGKDADGGRTILSTVTTEYVACSVDSGLSSTVVDETGRWTNENQYVLRFSFDPELNVHDEVIWDDPFSIATHRLVVLGSANKMGRGVTFEVNCVERI